MTTLQRTNTRAVLSALLEEAEIELAALKARSSRLETELGHTRSIGEATGLIMYRYRVGSGAAAEILTRLALDEGVDEMAVARRIIETGTWPVS